MNSKSADLQLASKPLFRGRYSSNKNTHKDKNGKNNDKQELSHSIGYSLVKNEIFGIGLTNETEESILEYIVKKIEETTENFYIVTPNPEIVMLARKNPTLKKVLNEAKIALCDGIGLYGAGYLLGKPIKERVIGTNLMEKLCEQVVNRPITVGFLGAGPGVAEKAAECLTARYPGLQVVFAEAEWPESDGGRSLSHFAEPFDGSKRKNSQNPVSLSAIRHHPSVISNSSSESNFSSLQNEQASALQYHQPEHIDILFVAFGAPKQELWMQEHLNKIPVRVMMGVGGAFDQIVTPSLRPPRLIHSLGLGWMYRLVREPWRLKRQLRLLSFILWVLQEKFS